MAGDRLCAYTRRLPLLLPTPIPAFSSPPLLFLSRSLRFRSLVSFPRTPLAQPPPAPLATMKTSFAALAALVLGSSVAQASLAPQPTPVSVLSHTIPLSLAHTPSTQHLNHVKRQQFPDGINLSAMLADPSSYMHGVSSALHDSEYGAQFASAYASMAHDPSFASSLSKGIKEQFGLKTAAAAMSQYTHAASNFVHDTSSSQPAAAATTQSHYTFGANNADMASGSSSTASSQKLSAVTSGVAPRAASHTVALASGAALVMALVLL